MTRLLDRISDETRTLHQELESDGETLLADISVAGYRRFLCRWYGFVAPVEQALVEIGHVHDRRRLHKHMLLAHDLQALGLDPLAVRALPRCAPVSFHDVREAVGWAFVLERSTLDHPTLYRRLAGAIPGEIAFASSYLKCHAGSVGETWRSFGQTIEAASTSSEDDDHILEAARAGYRHFRRWRLTLDGKTSSIVETPSHSCERVS